MSDRRDVHAKLSQRLADMSTTELIGLIESVEPQAGWGMTRTVDIDGHQVFVKTIPVTNLELTSQLSTRNVFGLPSFYNYGVGSAGFGAGREVAAHVITTRWVLDGEIDAFPLLYHHRLLPLGGQGRRWEGDRLDRYMTSWDDDLAIRRFIEARQSSTHSIALFCEHIPHVLQDWLPEHQDALPSVIDQARAATDFLRSRNAIHLDVNPSNVLTDGDRVFLADFGLFLDATFELTDEEDEFRRAHRFYDIAEFVFCLDQPGPGQTTEPGSRYERVLAPYRDLIEATAAFFEQISVGPKRTDLYDDAVIEQLLSEVVP